MDQVALGRKIKLFREESRLSQEEVEKLVGLPTKAMTAIEKGMRKVSTLELAKFAEIFHVRITDFFPREDQEEDLLVTLHRVALGLESDSNVCDQVAKCIEICREGAFLKEVLGLSQIQSIRTYSQQPPKNLQEAILQGEEVAREERRRLDLGEAPIFNIGKLIGSQGVWAAETLLPDQMSGLFLHHSSIGMAIIVNSSHVRSRKRFSYAHEYAHALFDAKRSVTVSASHDSATLVETRANAFASAFLMPSGGVASLLHSMGKGEKSRVEISVYDPSLDDVIEERYRPPSPKISSRVVAWIAHHFGVSYHATVYRLQNLGYFGAREREKLLNEEFNGKEYLECLRYVEGQGEEALQNQDLKAYVIGLAIEAFQREEISRGRLLALSKSLNFPGDKILHLAEV